MILSFMLRSPAPVLIAVAIMSQPLCLGVGVPPGARPQLEWSLAVTELRSQCTVVIELWSQVHGAPQLRQRCFLCQPSTQRRHGHAPWTPGGVVRVACT